MRALEEITAEVEHAMSIIDIDGLRKLAEEVSIQDTPRARAVHENALGVINFRTGENQQALVHFQRSLDLDTELGDQGGVARVCGNMGSVYADTSDYFRIGIHHGPLVAGIIGKQRLQYDVWGDTANVASRMESTGEAGRIQVSDEFAVALGPTFPGLRERGIMEIKGKGQMKTFWLEGA